MEHMYIGDIGMSQELVDKFLKEGVESTLDVHHFPLETLSKEELVELAYGLQGDLLDKKNTVPEKKATTKPAKKKLLGKKKK